MLTTQSGADDAPAAETVSVSTGPWQLRLLGAVSARCGEVEIQRWPSRAATLLLARLALAPDESQPREALIEQLWPGVAAGVGRNRLRQVLSTLRGLLEPEGMPAVLLADRHYIRLIPGRLQSDVQRVQQALREGDTAAARASCGGELLPGFYEDWVLETRRWLAEQLERSTRASGRVLASTMALPSPWTGSFGLEPALQRLQAGLQSQRLTTIMAAGGSGKTRLAVEVARALQAQTGGERAFERIVFVELAHCRDEADIGQALAHALGVAGGEPIEEACLMLRTGRHLLVLDNAEQIVAPLRGIVVSLLRAAPDLHLLLTSRRRLHLPGEHVFPLAGLPTPEIGAAEPVLRQSPAVALFIDRARAFRPDLADEASELVAIGALVRELDGLPLAIELAAARMGSMTPAEMLARLQRDDPHAGQAQLELLRRDGDTQARHASMRAVFVWSWDLLDAQRQRLLAAVGVVAGSADLERLAQVLQEPPLRVLRMVDELVGHSMLRRVSDPPSPRCALTAAMGEFVRQRWPEQDLQRLRLAWTQALVRWARGLGCAAFGPRLTLELPTVHLLLATPTVTAEAAGAALDLTLALRPHWESAGMPLKQQAAIEKLLHDGDADHGAARASAVFELLAQVRFEAGCVAEATQHAEAALRLAASEPRLRAAALVRRSRLMLASQRTQDDCAAGAVHRVLQEALDLAREAGDREIEARVLHQIGLLSGHLEGDWHTAEAAFARAQGIWERLAQPRNAMARLHNRAQCWVRLGRVDEARVGFEQALLAAREDDDLAGCIDNLISLAALQARCREWAHALAIGSECVALCWRRLHRHGLAHALWNPALPLAHLRQPEAAMRLMAFAARFWQETFGRLTSADQRAIRRVQALVRRQLGAPHAAACWTEGQALDPAQAVALLDRAVAAACADGG
ncbi:MAG TPA: hypothetical protein PKO45_02590 [Rubrivivax sp.]|nr:hypothetical protein [Rubrivivax sp.]